MAGAMPLQSDNANVDAESEDERSNVSRGASPPAPPPTGT